MKRNKILVIFLLSMSGICFGMESSIYSDIDNMLNSDESPNCDEFYVAWKQWSDSEYSEDDDDNKVPIDTQIYPAIQNGDLESVKTLIRERADIYQKDVSGNTPLHIAAQEGHKDIIKVLINEVIKREKQEGYLYEEEEISNALHRYVNAKNTFKKGLPHNTPLHLAAQNGHAHVIKTLVKYQANIYAGNHQFSENTPLHLAAQKGHTEAVKALLKAGSDSNQKNSHGETPKELWRECNRFLHLLALQQKFRNSGIESTETIDAFARKIISCIDYDNEYNIDDMIEQNHEEDSQIPIFHLAASNSNSDSEDSQEIILYSPEESESNDFFNSSYYSDSDNSDDSSDW